MDYNECHYRIHGLYPYGGDMGCWGFSVSLSKEFAKLAEDTPRPEGLETALIRHAEEYLGRYMTWVKKDGFYKSRCRDVATFHQDHCLIHGITVPGDACGIYRDSNGVSTFGPGYISYHPHNVDNIAQAFALLDLWLQWFELTETCIMSRLEKEKKNEEK